MKTFVGIDIGGTAIKIGLVDEGGHITFQKEYLANIENYKVPLIQIVKESAKDFLDICFQSEIELSGIGISATGQIDGSTGIVIGTGGNIKGWLHVNLKQEIGTLTQLPIAVENDVNCAAIAEHWIGSGQGFKHLFVYTIGTGVGGAWILNNQLYTGANGIAGEVGHMSIHMEGAFCTCGGIGCFEKYGSMTALLSHANSLTNLSIVSGRQFFEQLSTQQGKQLLEPILNQFIHDHSVALTNVIHMMNPEAILIGGGVSQQQQYLVDPIKEAVTRLAMPNFTKNLQIISAKLGNKAGMIGAVKNLMNQIQE